MPTASNGHPRRHCLRPRSSSHVAASDVTSELLGTPISNSAAAKVRAECASSGFCGCLRVPGSPCHSIIIEVREHDLYAESIIGFRVIIHGGRLGER
ncbi:hypothetical protein MRX96_043209 [Rhipicephalus microplus]